MTVSTDGNAIADFHRADISANCASTSAEYRSPITTNILFLNLLMRQIACSNISRSSVDEIVLGTMTTASISNSAGPLDQDTTGTEFENNILSNEAISHCCIDMII